MKRLIVIALFLNAFLIAGRLIQEANAGAAAPAPSRNGDVNCDGNLDLSDAVGILQFLFLGGEEPCALAAESGLEDRVRDLELALLDLQKSDRARRSGVGALSVSDAAFAAARIEADISARLAEVHAVATAGTDVTVKTDVALEFLDTVSTRLEAIRPIAPLSPRSINSPRAIATETNAALDALNAWIAAVNAEIEGTGAHYPQMFTAIAVAQTREQPLGVVSFLDGMVAANLASLRAVATGEEFVAADRALEALVDAWEDELASVGDDAQLANIDLQNMLQKQQQTLQTMSNVSKMLHDTAMAVIRKIG